MYELSLDNYMLPAIVPYDINLLDNEAREKQQRIAEIRALYIKQ